MAENEVGVHTTRLADTRGDLIPTYRQGGHHADTGTPWALHIDPQADIGKALPRRLVAREVSVVGAARFGEEVGTGAEAMEGPTGALQLETCAIAAVSHQDPRIIRRKAAKTAQHPLVLLRQRVEGTLTGGAEARRHA